MATNRCAAQRYAAGPYQDWPRLSEDAERYLDSPTAGTLTGIPGQVPDSLGTFQKFTQ